MRSSGKVITEEVINNPERFAADPEARGVSGLPLKRQSVQSEQREERYTLTG